MIVKSLLALLLTENTKSRHFTRYFSVRLFSVPPLPSFDFGIGRLFSVRHFSVSYFTCSTYFCFDIFRVAIQLFVLFSLSYFLVQSKKHLDSPNRQLENSMYTGATFDSSGQFYSLRYESLTYLGGWQGVGRSISDRMSYKNHYMCSGEATS